jgi:hypothetical protein
MSEIEAALQTLAERGEWVGRTGGNPEAVRAEIGRAARRRGWRIETSTDRIGRPHAATRDGLPAEEPWRGAAEHMRDVEPFASIRLAWQDRPKGRS